MPVAVDTSPECVMRAEDISGMTGDSNNHALPGRGCHKEAQRAQNNSDDRFVFLAPFRGCLFFSSGRKFGPDERVTAFARAIIDPITLI